jgi:hypothetical protein
MLPAGHVGFLRALARVVTQALRREPVRRQEGLRVKPPDRESHSSDLRAHSTTGRGRGNTVHMRGMRRWHG